MYVQGDNKFVDHYIFAGTDEFKPDDKFPFVEVAGKILKDTPEEYTDVRGLVTADYQEYLEKEWIAHLRDKYPVKINQKVLRKIQKN